MTDTPADDTSSPIYLWRVLREYIRHACVLFGLPSALAQRIWLPRAEAKRIADWLRALEHMLRRLIFLDAAALPPPAPQPAPESKTRARLAMGASAGAHFDIDQSETWRASFDLRIHADRRRRGASRPNAAPAVNAVSAAPLALRLEALIRGYNNREKLAARLARKLHREPGAARRFIASVRRSDRSRPGFAQVELVNVHTQPAYAGSRWRGAG